MMNREEFGRKLSRTNFKAKFLQSPGRIKDSYEKPQSEYIVSGPRYEPGTS
jgi:hypothetical protein